MSIKVVASNRKARHDYFLLDHYEAGVALKGSEIKSIRAGQISLKEAFIQVNGREAWLMDCHIAPYQQSGAFNHDPRRPRRLLLHRREIDRLWDEVRKKGLTIIPTRVYLKHGRAKIEIAVAKGKKQYDKRQSIKKRDAQREIERQTSQRR